MKTLVALLCLSSVAAACPVAQVQQFAAAPQVAVAPQCVCAEVQTQVQYVQPQVEVVVAQPQAVAVAVPQTQYFVPAVQQFAAAAYTPPVAAQFAAPPQRRGLLGRPRRDVFKQRTVVRGAAAAALVGRSATLY